VHARWSGVRAHNNAVWRADELMSEVFSLDERTQCISNQIERRAVPCTIRHPRAEMDADGDGCTS
jgi:hypothetical protein